MSKKLVATARVRVVLELQVGSWGDDCPMAQVYRQAADSALEQVRAGRLQAARVLGEPEVVAILAEHER